MCVYFKGSKGCSRGGEGPGYASLRDLPEFDVAVLRPRGKQRVMEGRKVKVCYKTWCIRMCVCDGVWWEKVREDVLQLQPRKWLGQETSLRLLCEAHRPECPATCGKLVNRPQLSIGSTAILPTPQRRGNRGRETEGGIQMEGDGGKGKRQELTSDAKLLDALLVHTGHQKLFISHMQPHIYAASWWPPDGLLMVSWWSRTVSAAISSQLQRGRLI